MSSLDTEGSASESESERYTDASAGDSGEDPTARACSPEIESSHPDPPTLGTASQPARRRCRASTYISGIKRRHTHCLGKHAAMVRTGLSSNARTGAHFVVITAIRNPGKENTLTIRTGCSTSMESFIQKLRLPTMIPWSLQAASFERQQARTVHKPTPVSGLPQALVALAVRLGLMVAIHACSRRFPWTAGPAAVAAAAAVGATIADGAGGAASTVVVAAAPVGGAGGAESSAAAAAAPAGGAGGAMGSASAPAGGIGETSGGVATAAGRTGCTERSVGSAAVADGSAGGAGGAEDSEIAAAMPVGAALGAEGNAATAAGSACGAGEAAGSAAAASAGGAGRAIGSVATGPPADGTGGVDAAADSVVAPAGSARDAHLVLAELVDREYPWLNLRRRWTNPQGSDWSMAELVAIFTQLALNLPLHQREEWQRRIQEQRDWRSEATRMSIKDAINIEREHAKRIRAEDGAHDAGAAGDSYSDVFQQYPFPFTIRAKLDDMMWDARHGE